MQVIIQEIGDLVKSEKSHQFASSCRPFTLSPCHPSYRFSPASIRTGKLFPAGGSGQVA